jgi:hypothetical protein
MSPKPESNPRHGRVAVVLALALAGCVPENDWNPGGDAGPDDGDDDGAPAAADADGDGIADLHEGAAAGTDTDGDGVPDYLDSDSDGDGIPDAIESGTFGDADRAPTDSDGDGVHDFRDMDSDGNGVFDSTEGGADSDGDGTGDHADVDNDGDSITDATEIGPNPSAPRDTDGDGTLDYHDLDSDGDTISDVHESAVDTDRDGLADSIDLDSDDDGIADAAEAGDTDPTTAPVDTDDDLVADFRDTDSDNDGLSDAAEHASGSSPTDDDSDDDGVPDLIEVAAGTDALDPADSPRARGDFVFLVPYQDDPNPAQDTLSFSTDVQVADVYFLMDTTGSMGGSISGLQTALTGAIIPGIAAAIPDVNFGVGRFADYPYGSYGGGSDVAFANLQHMTDSTAAAQAAVNTMFASGGADGPESHVPALHAVATGCGDGSIPADPACGDAALVGYPHFRPGAVPIVVLFSDAPFHNGPSGYPYGGIPGVTPPSYAQTVDALNAIHARLIGVNSSGARADMERLGRDTGTVDASGTPFVYDQWGGDFGTLVVNAVAAVANGVPMDIASRGVDDPSDAVDATVFVDRIVPAVSPIAPCALGLAVAGDSYVGVTPGATVCFDIVPARNETVVPTAEPQIFMATVQVWGDEVTVLDERAVFFLVPPVIEGPGGPD